MLRKILITLGIILVVLVAAFLILRSYTKSFSPEDSASIDISGLNVAVNYNQPSKKGRLIFGEAEKGALCPYGKVWRTGANEATVISFSSDAIIADRPLAAGKYSLWTIPGAETWSLIFNSQTGQWGTMYDETKNVLKVEVPSSPMTEVEELLTIDFNKQDSVAYLRLRWDQTEVQLPIAKK